MGEGGLGCTGWGRGGGGEVYKGGGGEVLRLLLLRIRAQLSAATAAVWQSLTSHTSGQQQQLGKA